MTGRIGPDAVNVANYVAIGKEPMEPYETSWPESFYQAYHVYQLYVYQTKIRRLLLY